MTKQAERLLWLREQTGLNQSDFALALGVNQPATVSRWENGHSTPQKGQILALANYFDVPPNAMKAYVEKGGTLPNIKIRKVVQNSLTPNGSASLNTIAGTSQGASQVGEVAMLQEQVGRLRRIIGERDETIDRMEEAIDSLRLEVEALKRRALPKAAGAESMSLNKPPER